MLDGGGHVVQGPGKCSLSRLPRVHQPRLIFTGSLARVATRAAKEPAQNLIFTIILLVVGIDSLSHQSRITIVPLINPIPYLFTHG